MSQLFLYKPPSAEQPTLEASIKAWANAGFTAALVYTPSSFRFAKVVDSKLCDQAGDVPLTSVFEARLFGERAELRWLHRSNGKGDAVLVTDDANDHNLQIPHGWETLKPRNNEEGYVIVEMLPTQYILWGKEKEPENGWTILKSARIGELAVPLGTGGGFDNRIVLKAREYLEAREDGNVVVTEERLLGLAGLTKGNQDA